MNPDLNEGTSTKLAAYAVYSNTVELQRVVQALNQAGFPDEDICLVLAPAHPLATLARNLKLLSVETDHAALCGLIDWLLRLGAVVIPQVGLFIRSRNFFRALIVESKTSACSGSAGALLNLEIPEHHAQGIGGAKTDSGGLVYVRCGRMPMAHWAKEILRGTGAEEAHCFQDTAALGGNLSQHFPLAQGMAAN